jgi:hypothetical protein
MKPFSMLRRAVSGVALFSVGAMALAVTATLATGSLMLGVAPAVAAPATKAPSGKLAMTAVCASAVSGGFASVSVSGKVTNLRPNTSFGITVNQPASFQVTFQDPVVMSDARGVLALKAVTINAATDHKPPYTSGAASFNALYTDLIGGQGGGMGLEADLDVTIDTHKCP